MKPYFTGEQKTPCNRVTTCRNALELPILTELGRQLAMVLIFEMLGNFSFGDYFKKDAITWAWEFVTQDLQMPEDRLLGNYIC